MNKNYDIEVIDIVSTQDNNKLDNDNSLIVHSYTNKNYKENHTSYKYTYQNNAKILKLNPFISIFMLLIFFIGVFLFVGLFSLFVLATIFIVFLSNITYKLVRKIKK